DLESDRFTPEPLLSGCRHPVCITCARSVTDYSCRACNKPWDVRTFTFEVDKRKVVVEHYGGCKLCPSSELLIYGSGKPQAYQIHECGQPHGAPFEITKALAKKFFPWENFDEILDNICRNPVPGCEIIAFRRGPERSFF